VGGGGGEVGTKKKDFQKELEKTENLSKRRKFFKCSVLEIEGRAGLELWISARTIDSLSRKSKFIILSRSGNNVDFAFIDVPW